MSADRRRTLARAGLVAWLVLLVVASVSVGADAPDHATRQLLAGVARLEVRRPGGDPDVGSGVIVGVERSRVYVVTALHVVAGPEPERSRSGWERDPERIRISVQFLGDAVIFPARLFNRWSEANDLAVVVVDDPRVVERGLAVAFGRGSPRTLSPPYPALAIGHGGRRDWGWVHTRVTATAADAIVFGGTGIEPGHSGGPLIDTTRHLLIGMITGVAHGRGGEAVSADTLAAELDAWGIPHHLRTTRISTPMTRVPAGPFVMAPEESGRGGDGPREVFLDAYFIDKYEVTVADFRRFVETTGHLYRPGLATCNYGHPEKGSFPMNCITWNDAAAFATWAGKRLPSEAQWEKAARGTAGARFPWGADVPRRGDAALQVEWPVEVGSHPRDRSVHGTMDMLGNVSEWVADWYQRSPLQSLIPRNPRGPASGQDRVLRGASFASRLDRADLAVRKRDLPESGRMRFDYGFRCVLEEREGG
jgi:formylglycine-generating enzyme required for sulfatase activity